LPVTGQSQDTLTLFLERKAWRYASSPWAHWRGFCGCRGLHRCGIVIIFSLLPISEYEPAKRQTLILWTYSITRLGNTPQHGVRFGMTGAGKSVIVADLLAEIGCRFGFRLIVEEGLLHAVLIQTQGCEPIIVNPNGNI
jgi:hypothetical protein